jgi:hypothetical protein
MRFGTAISLALIVLMALACTAAPVAPPPPAYSDAEVIGAVKGYLRSPGMDDFCKGLSHDFYNWVVRQDPSNPDKYLVSANNGYLTYTFIGSLGKVISTNDGIHLPAIMGC